MKKLKLAQQMRKKANENAKKRIDNVFLTVLKQIKQESNKGRTLLVYPPLDGALTDLLVNKLRNDNFSVYVTTFSEIVIKW